MIGQEPPPVHGSSVMFKTLSGVLARNGDEVQVASRDFSRTIGEVGAPTPRKARLALALLINVTRLLRNTDYDIIIHFTTTSRFSFPIDLLLSRLFHHPSRASRIAYLHSVGYESMADRSRLHRAAVKLLLQKFGIIVCLSESLTKDVRDLVRSDTRIVTIPNTPMYEPALFAGHPEHPVDTKPTAERHFTILFLANLLPEKGVDDFIGLAKLFEQDQSYSFLVAGAPMSGEQLAEFQARSPANTRFLGKVDDDQKRSLLSSASALVYPSRLQHEAQPLAIIEALSFGVPTIAYPAGAISDMIDPKSGIVVREQSVPGLASALRSLTSEFKYRQYRSGAMKRYSEKFSHDAYSSAWHVLVGETVQGVGE